MNMNAGQDWNEVIIRCGLLPYVFAARHEVLRKHALDVEPVLAISRTASLLPLAVCLGVKFCCLSCTLAWQ